MDGKGKPSVIDWLRDNYGWMKWLIGIIWSLMVAYGVYQKMKWDIDDIKKDMEAANIIEIKATVDGILKTNEDIQDKMDIILNHLLNQ